MKYVRGWFFVLTILLSSSFVFAQPLMQKGPDYQIGDRLVSQPDKAADEFREITWDDLIPPDWPPEDLLSGLFDDDDLDELEDTDPKAVEYLTKLRELWDAAPVVEKMNGQHVRLPGFVVPLEGNDKEIREFLLVPYFGACIHVPPPPANQLIHVLPDRSINADLNMMPIWVNGVLTVDRYDSEMGNAAYRMQGIRIEPYQE